MKYETPKLSTLMPAINAIELVPGDQKGPFTDQDAVTQDPILYNESSHAGAYLDWE